MSSITISKQEAKQYLVNYHLLSGTCNLLGIQGIIECFNRIKSIQFDPLDVVGKNPDLVLQSRVADYKPHMLYDLLYNQNKLVDGIDKEMCIYQSYEFSSFSRIREKHANAIKLHLEAHGAKEALTILPQIRDYIKQNGPTASRDLSVGKIGSGSWRYTKLSSGALDYLYAKGELLVKKKKGIQKYFDFTESVLDESLINNMEFKNDEAFINWYLKRRIRSLGLIWNKSGSAWLGYYLSKATIRKKAFEHLIYNDELRQIKIENINSYFYYPTDYEHCFSSNQNKKHIKFLAPLDNLLWDRDMVNALFNFNYKWEVYTPIEKRKYGYYVLPVLYGTDLIARFEPERQKNSDVFTIKNWWWETETIITNDLLGQIHIAIKSFANYLGLGYQDTCTDLLFNK